MSILDHMSDYPLSNKGQLLAKYAGKKLADLPVPAVVLDRAKLRKNCNAMLEVCETLGVGFRGHVKSHKV